MKQVSAKDFGKLMAEYATAVGRTHEQTVRAVALEWFSGVIRLTPVDTGRMRGNWLCSSGTPNYSVVSKTSAPSVSELSMGINPRGITYLTNNLSYAEQREKEGAGPIRGGKGKGGGFVESELKRVVGNMEAIVAGVKGT